MDLAIFIVIKERAPTIGPILLPPKRIYLVASGENAECGGAS